MSLKLSYTLLAPFYDWVARPAFVAARKQSIARLPRTGRCHVLLNGVGTGLDLPHLPRCHRYVGLDLTRAMLDRAAARAVRGGRGNGGFDLCFVQGDSGTLPFRDGCFDYAVLHLILAVVPDAGRGLSETARVLRPGGVVLLLDKFLRPGARAPVRRFVSPLAGRIVTRTDVVFEEALAMVPQLSVTSDVPALAGGWFRRISLVKSCHGNREP